MTVCIAAIAAQPVGSEAPYIVTVSDTMVSGGIFAADMNTVKSEPFHADWTAMMAADDLTQCIPIIEKAKEYFRKRENSLGVARKIFKRALQNHLVEMREDAVLSRYGMKMKDFLTGGKRRFTEKQFDSLCDEMKAIDPKLEFLIYGFDSNRRPHIFQVDGTGTDGVFDKPGFCAIGSGKWAAEAILFYLGQSVDNSLEETIFKVCAAKFAAERYGIGKHTYLYVKQRRTIMFSSKPGLVDEIRNSWEEQGAPRVPDGIVRTIHTFNPSCYPDANSIGPLGHSSTTSDQ